MRQILFFIVYIFSSLQVFSQSLPEFLQGTWKVENKETYEEWEMVTTRKYVGSSFKIKDDKKVVSENLSIMKAEKGVIYTAAVLNQNQGKAIEFRLNQIDENIFSFENPNHDFPKKIIYQKITDKQVYAQVLGKDKKGFSYNMFKVPTVTSIQKDSQGNWTEKKTYVLSNKGIFENAVSKIDTLPSGELMLTQTIVINAPVIKLWNTYTTPEEWKKWVTPVVEMDFRINGTIKSHYDSTATIGDKGTIVNHILNYIPYKQITMQAELNENFPEFMMGEEKNLYSIVEFEKLSENKTKLTVYGIGYKNEQQWLDLLKFFIQGNEMTLNNLKKYREN